MKETDSNTDFPPIDEKLVLALERWVEHSKVQFSLTDSAEDCLRKLAFQGGMRHVTLKLRSLYEITQRVKKDKVAAPDGIVQTGGIQYGA